MSGAKKNGFLLATVLCLPTMVVVAFMLMKNPFFGLMDDAALLRVVADIETQGIVRTGLGFIAEDYQNWGMFRPFYFISSAALYFAAGSSPLFLFTLNFIFVVCVLGLAGAAMSSALQQRTPGIHVVMAVLCASLAFPWTHDFFAHPSLQEKLVLLAGAAGLYWFSRPHFRMSRAGYFVFSFVILFLGFSTKAQFVVFVPAFLILAATQDRSGAVADTVFVFVVSALLASGLWMIAAHGTYRSSFGVGNIRANLFNIKTLMVAGFAFAYAFSWKKLLSSKNYKGFARACIPSVIMLGHLVLFMQWKLAGYHLSLLGPVFGFMAVDLVERMTGPLDHASAGKGRGLAVLLLVSAACIVSSVRSEFFFGRFSDIRKTVHSKSVHAMAAGGTEFFMSCPEGARSMTYFIERFAGAVAVFRPISEYDLSMARDRVIFADDRMCPDTRKAAVADKAADLKTRYYKLIR
ncbi:MAG: hypothetical protein A2583_07450 [Bdellovibrionales bacterium RIFOXYD1_FULL_53_11]|nr:MAG: hypothetical protein A2583_07450 [Bdellovibrionales bacterium RIFOXYD1_FULL_53_11]